MIKIKYTKLAKHMAYFMLVVILIIFAFTRCSNTPEEKYPKYEYAVDYYVPDSLYPNMSKWIQETVRATSQHLSAGDYEDPEDVIVQSKRTAEQLFNVRAEGLHKIRYDREYEPEFIPKERMIGWEKIIFDSLKREKHD